MKNMIRLRLFIFWLASILIISGLSLGLAQQELPALVKKVKPAVVLIYTYDSNGELLGQGSGFFVNAKGEVITNYHLLYGAYRGEVRTTQGMTHNIKGVIAEDIEGDLVKVVLDTSDKTFPYLRVSKRRPEEGEKVVVIGNPLGLEQTVSDGIVSAVRDTPPYGNIIQITAPISAGSSGSPVVNMDGEVIGVVALQVREGQSLNFAIPGEKIVNIKLNKKVITLQEEQWRLIERRKYEEWRKSREIQTPPETTTGIGGGWLESAQGLFFSGLTFLWEEDYEGALPYFEEAIKKKPDFAEAHYWLGWAYGMLGRHKEAIEPFKEAIRLKPDYAEAHNDLGYVYNKLGRHTEAIKAYKQAICIQPDFYLAHNNIGAVYHKLSRYREAIEAYKQAIRIKPDFAQAHYNLGLVYAKLSRYMEALEAFKLAISIQPDYAEAHYRLGLTYIVLGDKASALDEYKILKTLDPALANDLFNLIYK